MATVKVARAILEQLKDNGTLNKRMPIPFQIQQLLGLCQLYSYYSYQKKCRPHFKIRT